MSKGRVVMVTPNEPYPFGQANGRGCHALLTGLLNAGWSVRCLSVTQNPAWEQGARQLFAGRDVEFSFYPLHARSGSVLSRKWRTFREPFSYPLSDALRADVDVELRRGCDVLHLEQLWSGYLADHAPRSLTSIHQLASIDLDGAWAASPALIRSKLLMQWAERRLIGRLGNLRVSTPRLASVVVGVNPRAAVHVVPVALESSLFDFEPDDRTTEPTIGFIGSMNWHPGYAAAERLITRVFPLIRAKRPDAKLLIAGWQASLLDKYKSLPNVEIVENVPDARSYFLRLQVLAYPLPKGSGMMTKVLEAMAYGIPVVTTSEGIEGFNADHGRHAMLADEDQDFAAHVLRLLNDRSARRSMRLEARDLIEREYSPASTVSILERVYATL
jgi:glycosyltransferase involved in cell wall biosynthesis